MALKKIGVLSGWDTPTLGMPEFPQAKNGVDGLIWRPFIDRDGGLQLSCPGWRFAEAGDRITAEFRQLGIGTWTPLTEIFFEEDPELPVVINLKLGLLGHATYDFRFRVQSAADTDYLDFSEERRAIIDLFGPGKAPGGVSNAPAKMVYPGELPEGADITQDVLDLNPGGFDFEVPGYADWAVGDEMIEAWFTTMENLPPDDAPSLGFIPLADGTNIFNISVAQIAALEDGNHYAFYRKSDAAGNNSEVSRVPSGRRIKRALDLSLAPIVVITPPAGELIDILAWLTGVELEIPFYAGWLNGDNYVLEWGDQEHGPFPLSGVFPFKLDADAQDILDEYADNEGPIETEINYRIMRSGSISRPDTPTLARVDLSYIGPVVPIPGDESLDLDEVTIIGPASTPTPNYLNSADIDHVDPILAQFDLWIVDPEPVAGSIITLYWGNLTNVAGTYTIQATDGPGSPVSITVDKAAIAAMGNGDQDVFYGLSAPGSTNSNFSAKTTVDVDDAITHTMDAATILNLVPWVGAGNPDRATCSSLRPTGRFTPDSHLEVQIPGNTEFFADAVVVNMEFYVSTGLNGDMPLEPTRGSGTVTLDATTAVNGFIYKLMPFDPHLKVIGFDAPYNSLWFQYSVDMGGTSAKSVPAIVPIRMVSGASYCDLSPATP